MGKKPLTGIRLDSTLKEALQQAAAADGRSMAGLISRICQEWIDRQMVRKKPDVVTLPSTDG